MSKDNIRPCWEQQDCIDGKQAKECPAHDAWSAGKYCFEVASAFCVKALMAVSHDRGKDGGSLAACSTCDYFKEEVTPNLPKGQAMERLIKAKLIEEADGDKYQADRAAIDIDVEPRVQFLMRYEEADNPIDKMLILEERLTKIQLKLGNDTLQYAECYYFIRTEMDKLKPQIDGDT